MSLYTPNGILLTSPQEILAEEVDYFKTVYALAPESPVGSNIELFFQKNYDQILSVDQQLSCEGNISCAGTPGPPLAPPPPGVLMPFSWGFKKEKLEKSPAFPLNKPSNGVWICRFILLLCV